MTREPRRAGERARWWPPCSPSPWWQPWSREQPGVGIAPPASTVWPAMYTNGDAGFHPHPKKPHCTQPVAAHQPQHGSTAARRACLLIALAAVATWPSWLILAQVQPRWTSTRSLQGAASAQAPGPAGGGGDVPQALQFERRRPAGGQGRYHAPLRVYQEAAGERQPGGMLAAALKAHAPAWVEWADGPDTADVILRDSSSCSSGDASGGAAHNQQQPQQPASSSVLLRRRTRQHTVILQHGLAGCFTSNGTSSSTLSTQAAAAWQEALLVVNAANLELQVQASDPGMLDRLRLWSMPGGSAASEAGMVAPEEAAAHLSARSASNSSSLPHSLLRSSRLVVTFGQLAVQGDAEALQALVHATALSKHEVAVIGPSRVLHDVCGGSSAHTASGQARQQRQLQDWWSRALPVAAASTAAAGSSSQSGGRGMLAGRPHICGSVHHLPQVSPGQYVQLLKAARYVAVLHREQAWQPGVTDAVLLGRRLLLFNHTAPHQHYRWLRPYASLVEPSLKGAALTQQLAQVLAQQPLQQHDSQRKDAAELFAWQQLVPRFFGRVWDELSLARFPAPAVPLIEPLRDPAPSAASVAQHAAIDALTHACGAGGGDDVLYWDAAARSVARVPQEQYAARANLSCPPIILLSSWWDRSIGVCQDAAQLAVQWGHVPLIPAGLLARPVHARGVAAARPQYGQQPLRYHELCAGSVILSLSVAYAEVLAVMRNESTHAPGTLPLHKYWFMLNYDIMNKWDNSTVLLTQTADRLLCKTRACASLMRAWLAHNYQRLPAMGEHGVAYTAFTTPDPTASTGSSGSSGGGAAPDFTQFLHLMGKSPYKNAEAVVDAWARNPDLPPLTIATYEAATIERVRGYLNDSRGLGYAPLNIRLVHERMPVAQLNRLLLGIGNHVCPSQKEGFGHYINQARAASALLLTTDYPPMREFVGDDEQYGLACAYRFLSDMEVEMFSATNNPFLPRLSASYFPEEMAACIRRALGLSVSARKSLGHAARQRYLQEQALFAATMASLLQEAEAHVAAHRQLTARAVQQEEVHPDSDASLDAQQSSGAQEEAGEGDDYSGVQSAVVGGVA